MIFRKQFYAALLGILMAGLAVGAETNKVSAVNIFAKPLSLAEAMETALQQNSEILKSKADLQASYGIAIQTRAILIPKLVNTGSFSAQDPKSVEPFSTAPTTISGVPIPGFKGVSPDKRWTEDLRIVQSVYEGGRMTSALRTARLTKEQAMAQYQIATDDAMLAVYTSYQDALLAAQLISVQEASMKLLTNELKDVQSRFNAGSVPRFDVLRAEVELANARPGLISARNAYRIAKNNLADLLGVSLPKTVWEDIPLELSGKLEVTPYTVDLPMALNRAVEKRPELAALRKAEQLSRESVVNARAGYKPSAQIYGGYLWHSPNSRDDLGYDYSGWEAGAQLSWNVFDGRLTKGKIIEAEARHDRAKLEVDETARHIELEVRTAYSQFIQANEVLESQKKVQEEAEEALRLAESRLNAGSGIQLDVLNAQTALTSARTTQIQALHDHSVARVRLQHAIGDFPETIIVK